MSASILSAVPYAAPGATRSNAARWAGRIMTGIVVAFLAFDTTIHLLLVNAVVEGSAALGLTPGHMFTIGIIEVVCLALYLIPRTAVIGAVLWTGYLGGAIVTHLRVDNPLFTHTIFPIYVAALIWGGLYLRDSRVRALIAPTDR
jgi:hypothetical protein